MNDNRINYLDTLKGIGMLMVVLWHIDIFNVPWINGLWMPMFFVISGLFFKDSDNSKRYILKKLTEF